ncbi:MAG: HK97 family phage prohead protease [Propionibacteriales bacterium]|nr:HK97 family phage prohead protease [Propionibacteriales bacterium]
MDYRSTPNAVVDRPKADTLPRVVTGRAVPFNTPTDVGNVIETIDPAAFRDSLAKTPNIPLLTYHDHRADPVGVAVKWEHRADGLHGTWEFDDSPRAREVARLVKSGILRFFSIGFQLQETDWSVRNKREHAHVTKARLLEVSLVSTPAYADATVTGTRSASAEAATMARAYGAPMLTAAFSGTDAQVRAHTELVRRFVEEYGSRAGFELQNMALAQADPTAALNFARAGSALTDATPGSLSRVRLDAMRAQYGIPGDRPPPPHRRRRR